MKHTDADKEGRLKGPNRFGEEFIYPDYYEDKHGMRHALTEKDHADYTWSQDSRSEASSENNFGRGPKNFRRPDNRVHEDICEALTGNSELNPENVEVNVSEGVVTLTGSVESKFQKRLAEDLAEVIPGVNEVINSIRILKNTNGFFSGFDHSSGDEPGGLIKGLK